MVNDLELQEVFIYTFCAIFLYSIQNLSYNVVFFFSYLKPVLLAHIFRSMLVIERSELKQLSRLFRSSSSLSSGQSGSVSEMQEPLHLLTDDHFYSRHLRAQRGIHSELSAQGVELCCSYFHLIPFLHDEASATSHLASC